MQAIRDRVQANQRIHDVHGADGNRLVEYGFDLLTGTTTLLREYIWMDGRAVAVIGGWCAPGSFPV